MHELLLHAPLPSSRKDQVLSVLAGIAAMQPIPLHEEVHLYKPNRSPESSRPAQVGAVQGVSVPKAQSQMKAAMAGDLFYLRVVREVNGDIQTFGKSEDQTKQSDEVRMDVDGKKGDNMDVDSNVQKAEATHPSGSLSGSSTVAPPPILHFRDVPEAGLRKDRAVTSRFMADTPITSGSPSAFMKALNYSPVSFYYTEGYRLSHNNIALHMYRVYLLIGPQSKEEPLPRTTMKRADLKLLDESGAYVLEASVRVQDGSKVETMARGTNELLALRETLKGVVGLEMVERLALDTRVK